MPHIPIAPAFPSDGLFMLCGKPSPVSFESFCLRNDRAVRAKSPVAVLEMKAAGAHPLECPAYPINVEIVEVRCGAFDFRVQAEHGPRRADRVSFITELTPYARKLRGPGRSCHGPKRTSGKAGPNILCDNHRLANAIRLSSNRLSNNSGGKLSSQSRLPASTSSDCPTNAASRIHSHRNKVRGEKQTA